MNLDTIGRTLGRLASLIASALGILVGTAALVAPLWILATKARPWYNALVGIAVLGLVVWVAVRRLRSSRRRGARPEAAETKGTDR
jgi:membrane protein implicated in regulation of membrane protease activity